MKNEADQVVSSSPREPLVGWTEDPDDQLSHLFVAVDEGAAIKVCDEHRLGRGEWFPDRNMHLQCLLCIDMECERLARVSSQAGA